MLSVIAMHPLPVRPPTTRALTWQVLRVPIYASRAGTVTTATFGKSAGYYVTINHGDGFSSVYMHMTHYVVSKGTKVSQGQVIGYMGSTGVSTGNHLHFGISYNGSYVNPANYIAFY